MILLNEDLDEIIVYIDENSEYITVKKLATHFGYSYADFSRKFKQSVGISAKKYIAAIKMQKIIIKLEETEANILDVHLAEGYESTSTFANKFKRSTGATAKLFRKNKKMFIETIDTFEGMYDENFILSEVSKSISIQIETTSTFDGVIFVGLFNSLIPDHIPVKGTALFKKRHCTFATIPDGTHYLLAVGIEKNRSPKKYFLLDDCPRGKIETPITVPNLQQQAYTIVLREKIHTDPPILINLPKLLFDIVKESKKE